MTYEIDLATKIPALKGARILCVGDLMLDRFVYGAVERISPEAPVPVLRIKSERAMLGGAGNVVRNLVAMGADCCFVSLLGRDSPGREVMGLLAAEAAVESHVLTENDRPTTIKTRFVAGAQQVLRADHETAEFISGETESQIIARAEADLDQAKALILSDYGKGVLSDRVIHQLIARARDAGVAVVVDPKGNDFSRYRGATVVTPNRRELGIASDMPVNSVTEVEAAARALVAHTGIAHVLVTLSQDGMMLVSQGEAPIHAVAATAREVFDVSGAGDTVVATLAAALAAGLDLPAAVHLANAAAGVVVAKMGTAVASAEELASALLGTYFTNGDVKILAQSELSQKLTEWRRQGLKIGFTNGCFDLLHPGHISLFKQARAACDRLIVGLNSDASVQRLKGPSRPLNDQASRTVVLAALSHIDAVTVFDEDTPAELIAMVMPDVLIKGADYSIDQVVGADVVQAAGGSVLLARLEGGHSTTKTVAKITAKD